MDLIIKSIPTFCNRCETGWFRAGCGSLRSRQSRGPKRGGLRLAALPIGSSRRAIREESGGLRQTDEVETEDESFSSVISWKERISEAQYQTVEILKSVWIYVVIGIAIGAGIHGYAPTELITQWAGRDNPFAVLIATLIGVPLYTNVAGVLPIAEALVNKGMPLGTVLSFTMAVTALSLPQMIILKRVLLPQLLFIFIGLTTVGIYWSGLYV